MGTGMELHFSFIGTNHLLRYTMLMETKTITYSPKQQAEVPLAWKKAAGILRNSVKQNLTELKKLRREWNKRA